MDKHELPPRLAGLFQQLLDYLKWSVNGDAGPTLNTDEYYDFVAENWEKTQRLIKGKMNEETD